MKPINPEWYDELKGEPLRERQFTASLAASVQRRVTEPPARRDAGRRLAAAGLTAAIAAASAICYDGLAARPEHSGYEGDSVQSAAGSAAPFPASSSASDNVRVAVQFGPPVSFNYNPSVKPSHNALLEWQTEDRAKFEFWTVRNEDGSYLFGADYYNKEVDAQDWQPRGTAAFTERADDSGLSKGGLISHSFGYDNFTVFAGQVLDPNAESVQLTDDRGNRTEATIIRNPDGRFWVAVVGGSPSQYTMQALNRDGEALGDPVR